MPDLYLNAAPLTVEGPPDHVVGRSWLPDERLDTLMYEHPDRHARFNSRVFDGRTYVWPLPGHGLPGEAASAGELLLLAELPAAVLGSIARDSAARNLQAKGAWNCARVASACQLD